MADWLETAKIVGAFVGAGGIATLAKLYHDRVVTGKEIELKNKDAELARIRADLAKAEARTKAAEEDPLSGHRDLAKLRDQLGESVESLAKTIRAQAASLYVPIFSSRDDEMEIPRAFAFVAVYNIDPAASEAILRLKLVENWTIVGECWTKGTLLEDNNLQANARHVASYDSASGFVPVHTLAAPVRWQRRQVGVIQLFNKTSPGSVYEIDQNGFNSDDRRQLAAALQESTDAGIAGRTHYFQSSPEAVRFLGLQSELSLENAVIMFVDLTNSSLLFKELALLDAARLINNFQQNLYQCLKPYSAVVERFIGDGTLVRFHYGDFDSDQPTNDPTFRAVSAAAELVRNFSEFKARRWKDVPTETAEAVKLRVAVTLGPVISTNIGPREFQAPTVMGQCVNRAARLIAVAPRDRNVVFVDDNVRKSLMQLDRAHANALRAGEGLVESAARDSVSLAGHQYFELALEGFRFDARLRQTPQPRSP